MIHLLVRTLQKKIAGGAGDDNIDGGAGNDIIKDSQGNNTLTGGVGDDTFDVSGSTAPTATISVEKVPILYEFGNTLILVVYDYGVEILDGQGSRTTLTPAEIEPLVLHKLLILFLT